MFIRSSLTSGLGRFSNPENSLIRKFRAGTNVSRLTNHHCTSFSFYYESLKDREQCQHKSFQILWYTGISLLWQTRALARLAQLSPGFNSRDGHIFHLPVAEFGAVRVTSWVACGLSSYGEEPGIYLCFFWFFRFGNLWQGRSVTDLGIGPASSVGKSIRTVSGRSQVRFLGQPHFSPACYTLIKLQKLEPQGALIPHLSTMSNSIIS